MLAFILRRILQSVAVMAVVAFIAFGMFNFVGDPVAFMVGQDATLEERAQLRSELGLDQPFPVQFARFVGNAVQGDFGLSLRQGRPVATLSRSACRQRSSSPRSPPRCRARRRNSARRVHRVEARHRGSHTCCSRARWWASACRRS